MSLQTSSVGICAQKKTILTVPTVLALLEARLRESLAIAVSRITLRMKSGNSAVIISSNMASQVTGVE